MKCNSNFLSAICETTKAPLPALAMMTVLSGFISTAQAGIIIAPPPADTHTWDGTSGNDWQTASNWNTNQIPGDGDAVIIDEGWFTTWVLLNANTANLDSVYVSGEMKLISNGHRIRVGGSPATTTITQEYSTLQIQPENGTTMGKGIDTDELTIQNGATLWMTGGKAEVDQKLRIINDGLIKGYGRIDILGSQDAALAASAGRIEVDGGTLRFLMTNDGSMSVPSEIEIFGEDNRLRLDGPFHNPVQNVDIGSGGRLSISENWTLAGNLTATGNADSTIDGAGRGLYTGTVTKSGFSRLNIESEAHFPVGGVLNVNAFSELMLDNLWIVDSGHETNLTNAGRLIIGDDAGSFFGWNGNITMTGGVVEVNSQTTFDGTIIMHDGAPFGTPTFEGDADMWLTGTMLVHANPSLLPLDQWAFDGANVDVKSGAELHLGDGVSQTSTFIANGADFYGLGEYWVRVNHTVTGDAGAMIDSDLMNEGRLSPGYPTGLFSIGRDFTQVASGELNIGIAGTGLGEADRVDVGDDALLGGTLNVQLLAGYEPAFGSSFVVLTANDVVGEFDDVNGPDGTVVEYFSDQVIVTFEEPVACPGDASGDGEVGPADLAQVLGNWGPAVDSPSDFNGDGEVGPADLAIVLGNWGSCS